MENIRVQGIDGAPGGWVAAIWDGNTLSIKFYKSLSEADLWGFDLSLIDMPIGLPDVGRRGCDELARKALVSRKSSIFTTPCRDAVMAGSYHEACEINLRNQGIKISKQSWNIAPRIREVDLLLRSRSNSINPRLLTSVKESHPELCFQSLNKYGALKNSKATQEGQAERIILLNEIFGSDLLEPVIVDIDKKIIVDALDAIGLIANYLKRRGMLVMLGDGQLDRYGIPMGIWF